MALIAKRKVGTTWRQAVASRAESYGTAEACLSDFDARVAAGAGETEAAYRALEARGYLWRVDMPGDPASQPRHAKPADVPAV